MVKAKLHVFFLAMFSLISQNMCKYSFGRQVSVLSENLQYICGYFNKKIFVVLVKGHQRLYFRKYILTCIGINNDVGYFNKLGIFRSIDCFVLVHRGKNWHFKWKF